MCELLAVHSPRPFPIERVWPLVERLERFGIAGFGWGAAWIGASGRLEAYRDIRAFRADPAGIAAVGAATTDTLLVHLRRPSRLSTVSLPDTQPFLDAAGRFAFAHNGDFRDVGPRRAGYQAQDRIRGRADSEVAMRWLEDGWPRQTAGLQGAQDILRRLHRSFGGQANLGLLEPGGVHVYAGNTENPVFAFRLGELQLAATGLYSLDRSLFRFVAPEATRRRLVRHGTTESLILEHAAVDAAG